MTGFGGVKAYSSTLLIVALIASGPAPIPPPPASTPAPVASALPAGLAITFDQVDRMLGDYETPPPLTTFDADVQVAQFSSTGLGLPHTSFGQEMGDMALSYIPVIGTFFALAQAKHSKAQMEASMEMINSALNGVRPPTLTNYAFYDGWTRIESGGEAVITKPDQHVQILLNLDAKTYKTIDTDSPSPADGSPTPMVAPVPSPSPGTGTMQVTATSTTMPATVVNGQPTTGYAEDDAITVTEGAGSCQDATYGASVVEYVEQTPEPLAIEDQAALDALALPLGCSATIATAAPQSPAASPTGASPPAPSDLMYVYRLVTITRGPKIPEKSTSMHGWANPRSMMAAAEAATAQLPANYMMLSERGNFRVLTADDAAMFAIPAGFTETR